MAEEDGGFGICREGPFIYRELGSTSKYLKEAGEQAKIFLGVGLGSREP